MKTDLRPYPRVLALGLTLSACALAWAAPDTPKSGLGGTGRSTDETVAAPARSESSGVGGTGLHTGGGIGGTGMTAGGGIGGTGVWGPITRLNWMQASGGIGGTGQQPAPEPVLLASLDVNGLQIEINAETKMDLYTEAVRDVLGEGLVIAVLAEQDGDRLVARELIPVFEAMGSVERISTEELMVGGQRIVASAQDASLADTLRKLSTGEWVRASGLRRADGVLSVTRVDRLQREPAPRVRPDLRFAGRARDVVVAGFVQTIEANRSLRLAGQDFSFTAGDGAPVQATDNVLHQHVICRGRLEGDEVQLDHLDRVDRERGRGETDAVPGSSMEPPEQGERAERAERAERTERAERAERSERTERVDRVERAERTDRADRPERSERTDRPERTDRTERTERVERTDRTERSDRTNRD